MRAAVMARTVAGNVGVSAIGSLRLPAISPVVSGGTVRVVAMIAGPVAVAVIVVAVAAVGMPGVASRSLPA